MTNTGQNTCWTQFLAILLYTGGGCGLQSISISYFNPCHCTVTAVHILSFSASFSHRTLLRYCVSFGIGCRSSTQMETMETEDTSKAEEPSSQPTEKGDSQAKAPADEAAEQKEQSRCVFL